MIWFTAGKCRKPWAKIRTKAGVADGIEVRSRSRQGDIGGIKLPSHPQGADVDGIELESSEQRGKGSSAVLETRLRWMDECRTEFATTIPSGDFSGQMIFTCSRGYKTAVLHGKRKAIVV